MDSTPPQVFNLFVNILARKVCRTILQRDDDINIVCQKIGSYFWERMASFEKDEWKVRTREFNEEMELRGRQKAQPFWQFSKQFLLRNLTSLTQQFVLHIWNCFSVKDRERWSDLQTGACMFNVLCKELQKVSGAINCCCSAWISIQNNQNIESNGDTDAESDGSDDQVDEVDAQDSKVDDQDNEFDDQVVDLITF